MSLAAAPTIPSACLSRVEWRGLVALLGVVALMNIVAWSVLIGVVVPAHLTLGTQAFGVGLGVTAFTLGMWHAFDVDHITAIDNTTRKLLANGRKPVSVGFWFALGHSTVVIMLAAMVAAGATVVGTLTRDDSGTATEVTLLVLAGAGAAGGLPWYAVLVLPMLFTAGMTLFDTLDGAFINVAYRWAFANPIGKIYYNLTVTGRSVAVAMIIGSIELVGVLHDKLFLDDPVTNAFASIDLGDVGFIVVALFIIVWAAAVGFWKLGRVEQRWALPESAEPESAEPESAELMSAEPMSAEPMDMSR